MSPSSVSLRQLIQIGFESSWFDDDEYKRHPLREVPGVRVVMDLVVDRKLPQVKVD